MLCPYCKKNLKKTILRNVQVDYCPICLGIFFEKDELRFAKDATDRELNWLDIDLWGDKTKLKILKENIVCPFCELPMYEVSYGGSPVQVNICTICYGIWLDRGEFKAIINYLKEKAHYEILNNYLKNIFQEAKEIFGGPEGFNEELLDFFTLLKVLHYKFVTKFPELTEIIFKLPR